MGADGQAQNGNQIQLALADGSGVMQAHQIGLFVLFEIREQW